MTMNRRTKIVATLGPAVASSDRVEALEKAGMNVARLNCSHGDWDSKRDFVKWVRELHTGLSPLAILADLQGPKFRVGDIEGGSLAVQIGDRLTIGAGHGAAIPMKDDEIFAAMEPGSRILFGDGEVEIRLGECRGGVFEAEAVTGGEIKSRKGVTLVGKSFDVPCLTEKDVQDVHEAVKYGVDYIALSYVRRGRDMEELRRLVEPLDPDVRLIAKVETREALDRIDEVIEASDAVMVARGDLGLQMDIEDVPHAQKTIIRKCNLVGKPVITATQMLESMMTSARPTRAEASDVANAILDGTDAVMLSGETASGSYPIEAVRVMAKVAATTEATLGPRHRAGQDLSPAEGDSTTESVALAAVQIAQALKVRAILTATASGMTPRAVSKFGPSVPILAATWDTRTQNQLSLVWGVEAALMPPTENTDEAVAFLVKSFVERGMLQSGDRYVLATGYPPGTRGSTNNIVVQRVP
jgi:pyruvate kinase